MLEVWGAMGAGYTQVVGVHWCGCVVGKGGSARSTDDEANDDAVLVLQLLQRLTRGHPRAS